MTDAYPNTVEGECRLPNGCTLYWRDTEQGREYVSDEIGGGVLVWYTALVDSGTLLAALTKEQELTYFERIGRERMVAWMMRWPVWG